MPCREAKKCSRPVPIRRRRRPVLSNQRIPLTQSSGQADHGDSPVELTEFGHGVWRRLRSGFACGSPGPPVRMCNAPSMDAAMRLGKNASNLLTSPGALATASAARQQPDPPGLCQLISSAAGQTHTMGLSRQVCTLSDW